MYKMTYAEIMEGSAHAAREREKAALDRAIELMTAAQEKGTASPEVTEAVAYVQRLWTFFIENLTDPNNELAGSLKQDLISIGLWAVAESDRILADPSKGFSALIDVNKTIRDGLT
jgi:flagellar biosynthesis activator protein FlaF